MLRYILYSLTVSMFLLVSCGHQDQDGYEPAVSVTPTFSTSTPTLFTIPTDTLQSVQAGSPTPEIIQGCHIKKITDLVAEFRKISFSPDGSYLTFIAEANSNEYLTIMKLDGSLVKSLRIEEPSIGYLNPQWSPDGSSIAFVSSSIEEFGDKKCISIYQLKILDSHLEKVLDCPFEEGYYFSRLLWSPQGNWIAFQGFDPHQGYFDIYTIQVEKGDLRRLTYPPAVNRLQSWSPDGKQLAFVSESEPAQLQAYLYLLGLDSEVLRLIDVSKDIVDVGWSPDNRFLLYRGRENQTSTIYLYDFSSNTKTELLPNGTSSFSPQFSPDGQSILFLSEIDDKYELFLMARSGEDVRRLTNNLGPGSIESPMWMPDGMGIFLFLHDHELGSYDLYSIDYLDGCSK